MLVKLVVEETMHVPLGQFKNLTGKLKSFFHFRNRYIYISTILQLNAFDHLFRATGSYCHAPLTDNEKGTIELILLRVSRVVVDFAEAVEA